MSCGALKLQGAAAPVATGDAAAPSSACCCSLLTSNDVIKRQPDRTVEPSSGSNVTSRRAHPGLAGLGPYILRGLIDHEHVAMGREDVRFSLVCVRKTPHQRDLVPAFLMRAVSFDRGTHVALELRSHPAFEREAGRQRSFKCVYQGSIPTWPQHRYSRPPPPSSHNTMDREQWHNA